MRRSIVVIGAMLSVLLTTPAWTKANSFAQKDKAGHVLAYLTEGEDLTPKMDASHFGLPNTGLVMSVHQDDDGPVKLRFEGQGELPTDIPVVLSRHEDGMPSLWPMFVKLNGATPENGRAYLLGVVLERREGYSGGGASEQWLHLLRVDNPGSTAGRAREVLSVPLVADKLIRACFTERDQQMRQGICHDQFSLEAFLRLDENSQGDWPVFVYQSLASAQPGVLVSGQEVPARQLTAEELESKNDAECSFERKLSFNPMSRRYEMSAPGPDCSDYFVPTSEELYRS